MSERRLNRRKLSKFSIGDLRDRISLVRRETVPAVFDTPEPTEKHTEIAEVWAQVETPRISSVQGAGDKIYNGVNLEETPAYKFIIRHRDDIESHNTIIKWQGDIFKIVNTGTMSPQRRGQYLVIPATLAGDDTQEANQ